MWAASISWFFGKGGSGRLRFFCPSLVHPIQCVFQFLDDCRQIDLYYGRRSNQDVVQMGLQLAFKWKKAFAYAPFDPVPASVTADLLRSRDSDFAYPKVGGKAEMPGRDSFAALKDGFEPLFSESLSQEEILWRPFARRRFRVFCPSVVRMRTRNPCVLLRWRLLGW